MASTEMKASDKIDAAVQALRDKGIDPARVSYPCTIDAHENCTGKIRQGSTTSTVNCLCPECEMHPKL